MQIKKFKYERTDYYAYNVNMTDVFTMGRQPLVIVIKESHERYNERTTVITDGGLLLVPASILLRR